MNDQLLQPAMFDHLLNLNRFNNQRFFLRGLGHTFNNSINSIQLGSTLVGHYLHDIQGLVEELHDDPELICGDFKNQCDTILTTMSHVVQGISESTLKLDQFVSHLAEFSGLASATDKTSVDLNQLVSQCCVMTHHQATNFTNNFQLNLNDAPTVSPDCATQMTQVILNLLMNALLSLPDRSCEIVVSTSCDYETDRVLLCISDEGVGIPASVLPHISEPFFTTWQDHGCAGIGLTVSDRIIRNHGGDLSILSEHGKGTTVRVSLPHGKPVNRESQHAC
ncbi:MAG: hypothetical protein A2076_15065 [Geobacteraceae bacterium GWC2_53_11]|nr:MAG: hypothetical protein A2076_15065 [Geobacteraceae bacterium GWC2_53_11]